MFQPNNGSQLQKFVCAIKWMRNGIPTFSTIIRALSNFLETLYVKMGNLTRLAASSILLEAFGRGTSEKEAFEKF